MTELQNELGLPIGAPLADWTPRPIPGGEPLTGRFCRVEPVEPEQHGRDLFEAFSADREGRIWTYLPYGPFHTPGSLQDWLVQVSLESDPRFHAIVDTASGKAAGVASYLNIKPSTGVIEVGHINYSPSLQRCPAATEAMFLMMRRVFSELGYRRYEWKCDALNARSRRAALRFGFRFEGVFRNATIYKGRNRDTAWYSIIDSEWPAIERAFSQWLAPTNFDSSGRQKSSLSSLVDRRAGSRFSPNVQGQNRT